MYDKVKKLYATCSVKEGDWNVKINGVPLQPGGNYKYDYQEQITVVTNMKYSWTFSKHILPIPDSVIGSTKATISEYKYSMGTWDTLRE